MLVKPQCFRVRRTIYVEASTVLNAIYTHLPLFTYCTYTVLKTTFLGDRFFVHYLSAIFKACPPNVRVKNKNLNNCHKKSTKLHNLPRTQSGPGRWDFPTGPCVSLFLYIYIYMYLDGGGEELCQLCAWGPSRKQLHA